jgi:hypothetical protein
MQKKKKNLKKIRKAQLFDGLSDIFEIAEKESSKQRKKRTWKMYKFIGTV